MTSRKPIQVDFFTQGAAPEPKSEPPAPEPQPAPRSEPQPEDVLLADDGDEEDLGAVLSDFVKTIPKEDGAKDVDLAKEAELARHNTHVTQLRLIDMEKRRQRREKRTGRRDK